MQHYDMWIDGKWQASESKATFPSLDPYTGKDWATFAKGDFRDADAAVRSADRAFREGDWPAMTATQRGRVLYRLADMLEAHAEELADLEVADNGKLKAEMLVQMKYLPEWFRYYGGMCDKIEGRVTPIDKPGIFHQVVYEPYGVVVAIAPWNSPLLLATWKVAPALAAGNTIVVKPSEFSSASTLRFAEICHEAGLPPGVLNVVTGYGEEVGGALVEHPLTSRVAFTGSDVGGRAVALTAIKDFKPVSLELGGKSANIVFEDANLDDAVKGVISGIFAATGQTCMAGSRLLVHDSIHDEFVEKLLVFMQDAKLGDPRNAETNIAPVSTKPQFDKVLSFFEIAKAEGAKCVMGGTRSTRPGCEKGLFIEPTIYVGIDNRMRIAREEVFGPVLSVIRFGNDDEAVEIANDSPYGLAAGVWTRDLERSITLPRRIRAGTVWVNAYRVVSYLAPFGGFKQSGIGRENGAAAIFEYLEEKSIFINPKPGIANPFVLS